MSGKELTRFLGKVDSLLHEDLCQLSVDEVKVGLEHILSKIKAMLDNLQNNGNNYSTIIIYRYNMGYNRCL